jgi:hypothetical protein
MNVEELKEEYGPSQGVGVILAQLSRCQLVLARPQAVGQFRSTTVMVTQDQIREARSCFGGDFFYRLDLGRPKVRGRWFVEFQGY